MTQWIKGQSGNPAGKPQGAKDLKKRKRRRDAKPLPEATTASDVNEFLPSIGTGMRTKGYDDSPALSYARRILNREPATPPSVPTVTAGVKQPPIPTPSRRTTVEPEIETPLDPEPM